VTDWPDLAGRIEPGLHRLPVRVYYEDTDAGGVVYHSNYLKYCERGRSDCLRLLGVDQVAMLTAPVSERMFFVVRRMECDWLRPARLDDLVEVETRFRDMGGARMELDQAVVRGPDLLFTAKVTAVLVDGTGRPKRVPDPLRRLFQNMQNP
jgi:acyl-CoA thioester hydrolase